MRTFLFSGRLAVATLTFVFLTLAVWNSSAICGQPGAPAAPSGTSGTSAVYAKIILPLKGPAEGEHPLVESWIMRNLRKRGKADVRAVTHWVRLAEEGEEVARVWNAEVDGKLWGCPVVGRLAERTADGKRKVSLEGWASDVPKITGATLPAETGSRRIAVVDDGRAYVALVVGPPQAEVEPQSTHD